jgi:hypothetical protein
MGWMTAIWFPSRAGNFSFTAAFRPALEPTQPPIQWVPGALCVGVKPLGHEAEHPPPFSAEIKNAWSYSWTPPYVFMAWYLVKPTDNFTFNTYDFTGEIMTKLPADWCRSSVRYWVRVSARLLAVLTSGRRNVAFLNRFRLILGRYLEIGHVRILTYSPLMIV